MPSKATCIHVDTCTVDYINDHTGTLIGVHVDNASTWADVKHDLRNQIFDQEELSKDQIQWALEAVDRYFTARWMPNEIEEAVVNPNVPYNFEDKDIDKRDEIFSAWFRIIFN